MQQFTHFKYDADTAVHRSQKFPGTQQSFLQLD